LNRIVGALPGEWRVDPRGLTQMLWLRANSGHRLRL